MTVSFDTPGIVPPWLKATPDHPADNPGIVPPWLVSPPVIGPVDGAALQQVPATSYSPTTEPGDRTAALTDAVTAVAARTS